MMRLTSVRARCGALVLACACVAPVAATAVAAGAYDKPAAGSWKIQDSFEDTAGGQMRIAGNGQALSKLALNLGTDGREQCAATTLTLVGSVKIHSFSKANGRWAIGKIKAGLIESVPATFDLSGTKVRGTFRMLFDYDGRFLETGQIDLQGDCHVSFHARKAR